MVELTKKMPNFLIVGAPKCGTTALYKYLSAHPSVFMPEVKEPYYYIKPKEGIGEGPKDLSYRNFVDDQATYEELFRGVSSQHQAIGEASAGYLYFHELAISQIRSDLGSPKIIILIRDPVARAFSSHTHHVRAGREGNSFQTAWRLQRKHQEDGIWFGFQLKGVGLYAKSIAAYQEAFSHVKVILNDDLHTDTKRVVQEVFEFIGVDPSFPLAEVKRHNENLVPRSKLVSIVLSKFQRRGLVPKAFADWVNSWNLYKPKIPMDFASKVAPEFEEDLKETGKLIGRDLSFWLEKYK
jgi:hypothetical protein